MSELINECLTIISTAGFETIGLFGSDDAINQEPFIATMINFIVTTKATNIDYEPLAKLDVKLKKLMQENSGLASISVVTQTLFLEKFGQQLFNQAQHCYQQYNTCQTTSLKMFAR